MLYIRNLIYWLVLVLITPPMFTVIIPAALIPKGANHVGRAWALILVWMLKHIIGLKYRVVGAENIPDRPSIICSKHQSGWETLAFQEIFPLHVFVAKKELFKLPFFGWGLKLAKTIGIDRSNRTQANRQLMEQGLARKKEGFWITIFPEGTRLPPGTRGKYKLGAARMAKMFEMDLVPVALNSGEFWPRNSFLKYPGEITIIIGTPVAHSSGTPEELMAQCENWIECQQEKIDGAGPFAAKKAV
ncbi:1-acyl-SN-glycerol-3-phosphate acyltransferase [Neisseria animaloris]|uniref:lysophospholipid acyltransferase family protein n=1 Tax=Neisseria animaloris TaxID=326522 RepID=UPI000A193EC4|nr:lysophospholipid acyltransferase family protein [Neisseria animaloris]OSI06990.1 1-acyl-sn-glycerol-3-phosphate acyltransferase [Neisseria animaloris]VEH88166.1 1-acyl-SN-glycerol-3-phosphate acyltransferase [Neisseria animaloris]